MVVAGVHPSVNAAYHAHSETIGVSLTSVYNKLDNVEPRLAAELVRVTTARWREVVIATGGALPPLLPGSRVKILDGSHIAATEHRIKELRPLGAGALPGQALVVLEPEWMRITSVIPCEDGHAQERSMTGQILGLVRANDLWIDDRNFCTTRLLFGIRLREAFFVVRQHAATLRWELVGKRRARGRIDTGEVFEQTVRLSDPDSGEVYFARRITVVLDTPTRDHDTEIHLLTNLPAKDADAKTVAKLYRERWTIETAFTEIEKSLNGEINTLGYPKAALFAHCLAFLAYDMMSVVKAVLRAVHSEETVEETVSGYYLADDIAMTHRGMMIAIPEDEWMVFQALPPTEMAAVRLELAGKVRLARYPKQRRGPKKPRPKRLSGAKTKHISTAKILKARHKCTK